MKQMQTIEREQAEQEQPLEHIKASVAGQLAEVELRLKQDAESAPPVAASAYGHMLQGGGKRLRPLLVLLAAAATGTSNRQVQLAAVTVEQIHLASLMHDDVLDEADSRRGQVTVRTLLGNAQAVLTGDYLVAYAYHQIAQHDGTRIVPVLTEAVVQMCQAELYAMQWRGKLPTEARYLRIISGKTAALMAAAAHLGALCGDAADLEQGALRCYGYNLGMAFQIGDDLLDLYGDPAVLGKPIGQDLQAGQFTLPVIYARQQLGAGPLQELIEQFIVRRPESEQIAQATELIERLGGREYAEHRARHHADQAQAALAELRESVAREALSRLADYVVERRH